jgi:hypothetical protein
MKKYALAFEYDLKRGAAYLARHEEGHGGVALFDTRDEAKRWFYESGEIDPDLWSAPNVIELDLDTDDIALAAERFLASR